MAFGGQFLPQRPEVLDDAVMHDGEFGRSVRMGVGLGRLAVGRPAGVADADRAGKRMRGEFGFQILEFALGAAPREPAVLKVAIPADRSPDIRGA